MKRRLFIINPAAGAGRALSAWRQLQPELARCRLDGDRYITARPEEALEIAAKHGPDYGTVVAVGGDGTVFEVVSGLLSGGKTPAALGLIPCGTGNDIAQNLGIASTEKALAALKAGTRRVLDTIAITCQNGNKAVERHALMFAAAGIIGPLLRFTTAGTKRLLGRHLAYRFAAIRALVSYRAQKLQVECDGQELQQSLLYVGAHNTENFGGGMRVAPGARPDDGVMNVVLVGAVGRLEALWQFRRLCRGTHTNHRHVRYLTALNLAITGPPGMDVAADGELLGTTPAQFRICPRSISVLALPQQTEVDQAC